VSGLIKEIDCDQVNPRILKNPAGKAQENSASGKSVPSRQKRKRKTTLVLAVEKEKQSGRATCPGAKNPRRESPGGGYARFRLRSKRGQEIMSTKGSGECKKYCQRKTSRGVDPCTPKPQGPKSPVWGKKPALTGEGPLIREIGGEDRQAPSLQKKKGTEQGQELPFHLGTSVERGTKE